MMTDALTTQPQSLNKLKTWQHYFETFSDNTDSKQFTHLEYTDTQVALNWF